MRSLGFWAYHYAIIFGSIVLFMDTVIPEHLARGLEMVVGLMLVGFGGDVLHRLMDGMAESAVIILLTLGAVSSPLQGRLYILIYGFGSMLGMVLLSVVVSVPKRLSVRRLTWAHNGFQAVVSSLTFALGLRVIYQR